MIASANTMLQILAQEVVESTVDIMYNEYVDEMCAGGEMLMYSSQSYDNDCYAYGGK
jgi:hypothetical protein